MNGLVSNKIQMKHYIIIINKQTSELWCHPIKVKLTITCEQYNCIAILMVHILIKTDDVEKDEQKRTDLKHKFAHGFKLFCGVVLSMKKRVVGHLPQLHHNVTQLTL